MILTLPVYVKDCKERIKWTELDIYTYLYMYIYGQGKYAR